VLGIGGTVASKELQKETRKQAALTSYLLIVIVGVVGRNAGAMVPDLGRGVTS
jgi:hypothetical protein